MLVLKEDTVNLIVWSAAELAITMVCAGIPVIRPLFRQGRESRSSTASSSNGKKRSGRGYISHSSNVELHHLGHNEHNRSDEEMLATGHGCSEGGKAEASQ